MPEIDWSLFAQPADIGGHFKQGYETAKAAREKAYQGSVMSALAQNPNDTGAISALAQVNPEGAMQYQDYQSKRQMTHQKAQTDQLEMHRENIVKGAQIIRQVAPKDQAGWDQALSVAQQAGIDLTHVPRQYDPQYTQGMVQLADTFEPVKPEASNNQFLINDNGVYVGDRRAGTVREAIRANDGTHAPGTPVNAPHIMTDAEMLALEGGQTPGSGNFHR